MVITFPGESPEYRAARNALLDQEIGLRRTMEAVAAARRALPPGGVVPEDYVFDTVDAAGRAVTVRLSELFALGNDSLIVYTMMFPRHAGDERPGPRTGETSKLPLAETPCPSCTSLLDQLDGSVPHVEPRANFVVVAKTTAQRLTTFGRERGWRHLRLVSSAHNTFNRDYNAEDEHGMQQPMLNVFHRDGSTIRHFWGSELLYAPTDAGQDTRHVGTIEPLWNLFDFTREGRDPDFDEQMDY
jgi:predicted dithiol-disulfide oxidoreductase (DUF899 family)